MKKGGMTLDNLLNQLKTDGKKRQKEKGKIICESLCSAQKILQLRKSLLAAKASIPRVSVDMFANNLENLPKYLNITNNDWDLEMWEKAAHPDLEVGFFVASGIWMSINVIVGTVANGAVLLAFFRDLKVSF